MSVASVVSESKDYQRCRLAGFPADMWYPASASELQEFRTWEAEAYETANGDDSALSVDHITETLVFNLVSAFLRGTELNGHTVLLRFEEYKYREFLNVDHLFPLITCYDNSTKKQEEIHTSCGHC